MKNILLLSLLLLVSPLAHSAAHGHNHELQGTDQTTEVSKQNRAKWFKEAKEMKRQFLVKELSLPKEQQKEFFDIYDKMQEEIVKLQKDTRAMEKRVNELGDNASDLDYEKATDALYELKQKEAEIDLRYYAQLKKVLTPKQMFRLKGAERRFTRQLMDHHQKIKNSNGDKKK